MAGWRRNRRLPADAATPPLLDPDPLRTPDDAFETGFLIGSVKNVWQAIAVKNLKDRRIATAGSTADDAVGPAGQVAGEVAGHRATDE
jgi:hypothetical protein